MNLLSRNGRTYYELTSEGMDQFDSWINSVVVATNPKEVTPDGQFAYVEDKSNTKQLVSGGTARAYFVKSVKPEFRHLGNFSDEIEVEGQAFEDRENSGIQFYTPPATLLPGQYDVDYSIRLSDPTEQSSRYEGKYKLSFKLGETAIDYPEIIIARAIRKEFRPEELFDEFQYRPDGENRLFAAHRCFRTDFSNDEFPFHPIDGGRETLNPFEDQVNVISKVLGIPKPDFITA